MLVEKLPRRMDVKVVRRSLVEVKDNSNAVVAQAGRACAL